MKYNEIIIMRCRSDLSYITLHPIILQWKSELASCRCGRKKDTEITSYQETIRENALLKQQISDMRLMFDSTITQTQEECNTYLQTIEELKNQVRAFLRLQQHSLCISQRIECFLLLHDMITSVHLQI